ncbi:MULTISPECIES: peptidoglycan D,D-transpeptidase FtsI family protein [unclassified Paenibacillus]|uniref:peptidoglycan D,D-transpeptidase FtsI family protein n=1 Tax=unclassified Paenibacillus TaxID=185978 RepID=UPI002F41492B
MSKRLWKIGMAITVLLALFTIRLAWLQLIPSSWTTLATTAGTPEKLAKWKRTSIHQRQQSIVVNSGRGNFYDRYGNPITGESYMSLALFPAVFRHWEEQQETKLNELATLLSISRSDLLEYLKKQQDPAYWQDRNGRPIKLSDREAERIEQLHIDGIRVLPYQNRYIAAFENKHIIGFTSQHPEWLLRNEQKAVMSGKRSLTDQVGGSGLERSLEPLIHSVGATYASYYFDGRNYPLHGLDLRIKQPRNSYYPLEVITTIDLGLQNKLEEYADQIGLVEGAIVVLDANNADIAAMVSRPKLPQRFTASDGSQWTNYALKAVAPGSIYKLVTAAAALEAGMADKDELFYCNGSYGKYKLSCWKRDGHGAITWEEGLAQSCNIVFATLAERAGSERLERTASALGMLGQAGWQSKQTKALLPAKLRLLQEEEPGRIFLPEAAPVDGGVTAQSGIGQRDVAISPLQAANLVVTLLHSGTVLEPRSVKEIRYANHQTMVRLPVQTASSTSRIRQSTSAAILKGMEAVVERGTGKAIRPGIWRLAGKTGTAQVEKKGQERVHQWFIGYGPVQKPKYAAAVLSANRSTVSSNQAAVIFRGVMDIAAQLQR